MNEAAQRALDSRALEMAAASRELLDKLDARMTRHEEDCKEERRQATEQRHDFRAEMALTLSSMRDDLRAEITDLKADFIGAVRAFGLKLDGFHAENRGSITEIERTSRKTERASLLGLIAVLLSVCGAALTKAIGWW